MPFPTDAHNSFDSDSHFLLTPSEIGIYRFWIRSTPLPSPFTLVLRIGKSNLAEFTGFQVSWRIRLAGKFRPYCLWHPEQVIYHLLLKTAG